MINNNNNIWMEKDLLQDHTVVIPQQQVTLQYSYSPQSETAVTPIKKEGKVYIDEGENISIPFRTLTLATCGAMIASTILLVI